MSLMNKSPIHSKTDLVTYTVLCNGQEIKGHFDVLSIEIIKAINKIAFATVVLIDGDVADGEFALSEEKVFTPGNEITIKLGYHAKDEQVFKGIIIGQKIRLRRSGGSTLTLECYDKAIKMTARRKNGIFLKKKDSDVISQIIKDNGLTTKVDSTKVKHEQIIQYDVSDWDFILSRAETNGLVVVNQDGKIDVKKPKIKGKPVLEIQYGRSVFDFNIEMTSRGQIPGVTCEAWDVKKHKVVSAKSKPPQENKQGNITSRKLAQVMGTSRYEMQTSGFVLQNELQEWADAYMTKAALSRFQGSITFQGSAKIELNELLGLKGLGKRFNGDGYITGIEHIVEDGVWYTTCYIGLDDKWFVDKAREVNGMPTAGLLPAVSGLQVGIVKKIDQDPNGEFRIQVTMPTLGDISKGVWARLLMFYATKEAGSFFIPEVGTEVVLGFLNDDPRFPVIVGSLYGSKHKTPYPPEKNNNIKAIVTNSKMKIEFEEEKKMITIETPGGNSIVINDEKKSITMKDMNNNSVELSQNGITMDTAKDFTLKAKGKITLDATQAISVSSKMDVTVKGLNVTNKAQTAMSCQGLTAELKASTQAVVKGAMVMIN